MLTDRSEWFRVANLYRRSTPAQRTERRILEVGCPNETSFWQLFAKEFMHGDPHRGPCMADDDAHRHLWDELLDRDDPAKLRQLLDAQTDAGAAGHALRMLLWRCICPPPGKARFLYPTKCLAECVKHGASLMVDYGQVLDHGHHLFRKPGPWDRQKDGIGGHIRHFRNVCPEMYRLLLYWRKAHLWRTLRRAVVLGPILGYWMHVAAAPESKAARRALAHVAEVAATGRVQGAL